MRQNSIKKNISRLMALLLAAMLVFVSAPTVYADGESGACGDNLTWSLSAGTLTISGSGVMYDFPESSMAPWYHLREEITRLELPSGLTKIGTLAFYGCKNLTAVAIPNSVQEIGDYAFGKCLGMQMLTIGSGVTKIGKAAFANCEDLTSLSLPVNLVYIGPQAFYWCRSITTVTIPQWVTYIGRNAFAYCKNLVSADIQANLESLPDFVFYGCENLTSVFLSKKTTSISKDTFYGCDRLDTIYSAGTEKNQQQLQEDLGTNGTVTNQPPPASVTVNTSQDNGDGTTTNVGTTVTNGENTTVSSKVENTQPNGQTGGSYNAEINVTVENEKGWDEADKLVQKELGKYENQVINNDGESGDVNVNVYVKGETEIDPGFVENLSGQDVKVNIVTQNGSSWKIQGTELKSEDPSGKYSLVYTLAAGNADLNTQLGADTSFLLTFRDSSQVNTEVLIRVGTAWAQQEATLFQRGKDGLSQIQTVIVDRDGYAHFYLASVDKDTEYYIAMNLLVKAEQEAIVPDELLSSYGAAVRYEPIKYEITGRTSSWGMGLGKVMTILAMVMVSMIVIVGFVMYAWNKRRLKMGYVPDLDEEDYMQ